ncbi:TolB family protein [Sphingomonas sp. URHD0057]|uniref:TolB family protein n=1 Tax=Sphingomonas sp. URHD0057 TaxID=1380389 RepID=UPI00048E8158|nr:PD40 domain-containing protein [Sphingomonas sp. URHD0057]
MILLALAASAMCATTLIAGAPHENHIMFDGISPDGKTLAVGWDRGNAPNVERRAYLLNLQSGKRTDLAALNNAASFSPDGRFLVSANYAADRSLRTEVVELDRRTGKSRTFASGPSGEWLASYSADGRSILFNSTRSGTSDLYLAARADGHLKQLTSDPRYEAHGHLFDRGRKLLFHRQTDGDNYDVVIRDLPTGHEKLIGATPAEEAYPALSPDGRWLAFSAVPSPGAQPNLYIMRSDGSVRRRLTTGQAKDAYAAWAPNGRSIYFVRFDPDGSKIYRLGVRGGRCSS